MIFQPAHPFLLHKNEQGGHLYLVRCSLNTTCSLNRNTRVLTYEETNIQSTKLLWFCHKKKAYDKKYNATSFEKESYRVGDTVQHLNLAKEGKGARVGRKFEPHWLPVHGYFVVEKVGEYGDVVHIIDPKNPQGALLRRSIEHVRRFPGNPKHVSRAKGGPKSKRGVKRGLEWCHYSLKLIASYWFIKCFKFGNLFWPFWIGQISNAWIFIGII